MFQASNRLSTRPTQPTSMVEDEESEGIEYEEEEMKAPPRAYICTNLITPGKKTLADVRVDVFNEGMLGLLEA